MLWSIYPTDADSRVDLVASQASVGGGEVFTSLHLPEDHDRSRFLERLSELHQQYGLRFWADVSGRSLPGLEPASLAERGIIGLRLDDGFDVVTIRRIADDTCLRIALNASTATPAFVDALADLEPLGWHNFYPRPGTGLTEEAFDVGTSAFITRGLDVIAFLPGECGLRSPLYLGLPTLEHHRHRNAWLNIVDLLSRGVRPALAEGVLRREHLAWLRRLDQDGVLTLPLADLHPDRDDLRGVHQLRPDGGVGSWRVEGTRAGAVPDSVPGSVRRRGSLQVDTLGRYRGEVHLVREDLPLDPAWHRAGEVAGPYVELMSSLRGGQRVEFLSGWGSGADCDHDTAQPQQPSR